ncbi:MAG: class I SAM-dependent methyltransferase [Phycisphaeraceae bacterium]
MAKPRLDHLKRHAYLAGCFARLLLLDPWSSSGRERLRDTASDLKWGELSPGGRPASIEDLTPGSDDVRLISLDYALFNTSFFELFVLTRLVRHACPQSVFEIGTFDGRSTLNMALNTPDTTELLTFDLPPGHGTFGDRTEVGVRFRGHPLSSRITQLYGNTRYFDFTPYFGRCDFVFVDADHSYESANFDTDTALKLLKPEGGILLWHDYSNFAGVQRALDERMVEDPRFAGLTWIQGTTMALLEVGEVGVLGRAR